MKQLAYHTITGRAIDLGRVTDEERVFLRAVKRMCETRPEWSEFGAWWIQRVREAGLAGSSSIVRICADLEGRLGIAQGKVGTPDYRDYLADLIEERYGSRNRFCQETGVDPGHLSRVFASRADLSLQNLQRILDALQAQLVIEPRKSDPERWSPERAAEALAAALL
jgi:hypothetical protein